MSVTITIVCLCVLYVAFFVMWHSSNIDYKNIERKTTQANFSFLKQHYQSNAAVETVEIDGNMRCTELGSIWCSISIPISSHYRFTQSIDEELWNKAKILAASGRPVILEHIVKHFPNPLNFLDGDREFRRIHHMVDVFVDNNRSLSDLLVANKRNNKFEDVASSGGKYYVPARNYDFRWADRSPLVQLGHTIFEKNRNAFFTGNILGYSNLDTLKFLQQWNKVKDSIEVPIIALCQGNENWGMLSTMIPNRTAKWGRCCDSPKYRLLHEFLNHDKTLMLLVNQHHNLTHPKVLSLPRGIPLTWEATPRLVWDSMRYALKYIKKTKLLFAASSSWGKRPQIIRCISDKLSIEDFEGHSDVKIDKAMKANFSLMKTDRKLYYEKLSSAMFGLALPGLGYDCFRTWELLTMGTIVVIERGVGLDRTLWRLPALLVDDFDSVTTELLRSAYVEAIYRTLSGDFEFERLTQSYWYSLITNVSSSKSSVPLLDQFPMDAVDIKFTRPREPFDCWKTNSCGDGTKRIPKKSC